MEHRERTDQCQCLAISLPATVVTKHLNTNTINNCLPIKNLNMSVLKPLSSQFIYLFISSYFFIFFRQQRKRGERGDNIEQRVLAGLKIEPFSFKPHSEDHRQKPGESCFRLQGGASPPPSSDYAPTTYYNTMTHKPLSNITFFPCFYSFIHHYFVDNLKVRRGQRSRRHAP